METKMPRGRHGRHVRQEPDECVLPEEINENAVVVRESLVPAPELLDASEELAADDLETSAADDSRGADDRHRRKGVPLSAKRVKRSIFSSKRRSVIPVALLAMFGILVFCAKNAAAAYDNDMWWILATGREIMQTGIPYQNPFAMFDGLGTVIQQWLSCVILYVIYRATGMVGCEVFVFLQQILLVVCLFLLCRESRNARGGSDIALLLILLAFGAIQAYSSVRPHLYTMIMFSLVLLVLEKYRRTKQVKLLIALPLLVALHVNLHASMAPYDLFIIAVYLVPDIPQLLRDRGWSVGQWHMHAADYALLPLVGALAASAVALLLNPYGINGALYLVNSYGAADYHNYINEMGSTNMLVDYGIAAMCCTIVGSAAVGANGIKRLNVPLTLLFVVAIPLSIIHTRNVWMVSLFYLPLAAQAFSGACLWRPKLSFLNHKRANAVFSLVLVGCLGYYVGAAAWPEAFKDNESDSGSVPYSAANYLLEYAEEQGIDPRSLKVYNSFNNGGYLEWRGLRVFIDARPELWEPPITGVDEHYYREFVDFAQGRTTTRQLLETYTFDFMVVYSDCTLATDLTKRTDYQVVFASSGYKLWKHV